jgi:hypothetical protein
MPDPHAPVGPLEQGRKRRTPVRRSFAEISLLERKKFSLSLEGLEEVRAGSCSAFSIQVRAIVLGLSRVFWPIRPEVSITGPPTTSERILEANSNRCSRDSIFSAGYGPHSYRGSGRWLDGWTAHWK